MSFLYKFFVAAFFMLSCAYAQSQQLSYPFTHARDDADTIFGTIVPDPFRWLEKDRTASVVKWALKQDSIATEYIDGISVRYDIRPALRNIADYVNDCPTLDGNYYFRLMRPDHLETSSLYIRTTLHSGYDMLIDTRYFEGDSKIDIKSWQSSTKLDYLAFAFGKNGTDRIEAGVVKLPGGARLTDRLRNLANTDFAWRDSGFYYCRIQPAGHVSVCYHRLNTSQEEDKVVLEKTGFLNNRYSVKTTFNEHYLIISEYNTEQFTYNVYYKDLNDSLSFIKPIVAKARQPLYVLDEVDSNFICLTEYPNYPNGSIVSISPEDPLNWKAIVPHMPDLKIEDAIVLHDKVLVLLQDTFIQRLAFFSFDGQLLHAKAMPAGITCNNLNGNRINNNVLYNQESYCFPGSLYIIDSKTYEQQIYHRTYLNYKYEDFTFSQQLIKSKDGTEVPVFMLYDKYHPPSRNSPVLLEAYGGFNVSPSPQFDPTVVFFIQHGGVYVYANIRGGGFLSNWHKAGSGLNKQKSYDDVISVAEYLISKGYTSPEKLALKGGSNGGLMVGAVITQRPDLFKAAIADAGLFDMIRYENFYKGKSWKEEYGSVSDSVDFINLLSYSPYHHVKQNTTYPALLIYTSDNDDRVSPSHSYKMAARLQAVTSNPNPVLLKLLRLSGHSGPLTWSDYEEHAGDELAFLFHHLKMKW